MGFFTTDTFSLARGRFWRQQLGSLTAAGLVFSGSFLVAFLAASFFNPTRPSDAFTPQQAPADKLSLYPSQDLSVIGATTIDYVEQTPRYTIIPESSRPLLPPDNKSNITLQH